MSYLTVIRSHDRKVAINYYYYYTTCSGGVTLGTAYDGGGVHDNYYVRVGGGCSSRNVFRMT